MQERLMTSTHLRHDVPDLLAHALLEHKVVHGVQARGSQARAQQQGQEHGARACGCQGRGT